MVRPQPLALPRDAISQDRMVIAISTLDGLPAGRSLREIAIGLYGENIVAEEWNGASDFLKSRARRLVKWAAVLAEGGYFDLLR